MNRKMINWLGLTGPLALLSYAAAVIFSPLAYPGYNWMAQEVMHVVVTALVVACSVASLVCLIVAGCREKSVRGIGILAAVALLMMLVGSVGTGIVPPDYFGVAERFSVFAAVGFNAVLGWHLFCAFGEGLSET